MVVHVPKLMVTQFTYAIWNMLDELFLYEICFYKKQSIHHEDQY